MVEPDLGDARAGRDPDDKQPTLGARLERSESVTRAEPYGLVTWIGGGSPR